MGKEHIIIKERVRDSKAGVTANRRKTSERKGGRTSKKTATAHKRYFDWPRWSIWAGALIIAGLYGCIAYFFVNSDSFNWQGAYQDPELLKGYEIRGIDVSHHQGVIEWEKVRNARVNGAPITFAVIKATEGSDMVDPYFHRNISRARKAELTTGAYHFFNPKSDPDKQAELFIRNVTIEEGDLRPVLDVEHANPEITTLQFQKRVLRWLHLIEKEYGVKPIIYTGLHFKQAYLNTKDFDDYPLWLAHYYVDQIKYEGEWAIWQYTDRGEVKGIKGKVDCDIFNGTLTDFLTLTIRNF